MKPTLCSRCKKNVAVVFITRLDNNGQGSHNEGLCLKCARELNIRPLTDMIEKMGLSDEELEGLTNEMMSAFEGAESMEGLLGNLSGALSDAANGNDDDEEDGRTATFPFLNKLMGNLAPTEGNDAKEESIPDVSPQAADGGRAAREDKADRKNRGKRKFLENHCISLTRKAAEGKLDRMIGRERTPSHYEKITAPGEPVVSLEKVDYHKESKHNGLNGVSLTVGRGEIVGIAGVDGNGQSQLAQVVTGVLTPDAGHVDLKGSRVAQFTPNGFILESVSHIPEDRNKMGLIGSMSIQENIVLKSTDTPQFSSARGFRLKKRAIREYAEKMREKYDIRCTSVDQETRNLSGGNQQKVILARELEGHPDLLVAVHPTRGLDIGATRFVHDTMIEAREKGCGVLLISADFDEILEVSDRIVVMFEGQVMGVFSGKEPPIQDISLAMAGK